MKNRVTNIVLDTDVTLSPEWAQERDIALKDLADENSFALPDRNGVPPEPGPYHLHLALKDRRLVFDIRTSTDDRLTEFHLSFGPFADAVRDYAQICESYFAAVKNLPPAQIEAIDMARRGIHNEGARVLAERLEGKVAVDRATARRLFTLIFILMQAGSSK